jgi:hypothetical protein
LALKVSLPLTSCQRPVLFDIETADAVPRRQKVDAAAVRIRMSFIVGLRSKPTLLNEILGGHSTDITGKRAFAGRWRRSEGKPRANYVRGDGSRAVLRWRELDLLICGITKNWAAGYPLSPGDQQ